MQALHVINMSLFSSVLLPFKKRPPCDVTVGDDGLGVLPAAHNWPRRFGLALHRPYREQGHFTRSSLSRWRVSVVKFCFGRFLHVSVGRIGHTRWPAFSASGPALQIALSWCTLWFRVRSEVPVKYPTNIPSPQAFIHLSESPSALWQVGKWHRGQAATCTSGRVNPQHLLCVLPTSRTLMALQHASKYIESHWFSANLVIMDVLKGHLVVGSF